MTPRETIYSRLFAYFAALTTGGSPLFRSATRRLDTWDQFAPEDQPALLMQEQSETAIYHKGLPTAWKFNVAMFLYVSTQAHNDPSLIPGQILNPLLDALQEALVIDDHSNMTCTLGGIVSHCAIDGPVEIYQGNLGDEAVAILPLTVLVPA